MLVGRLDNSRETIDTHSNRIDPWEAFLTLKQCRKLVKMPDEVMLRIALRTRGQEGATELSARVSNHQWMGACMEALQNKYLLTPALNSRCWWRFTALVYRVATSQRAFHHQAQAQSSGSARLPRGRVYSHSEEKSRCWKRCCWRVYLRLTTSYVHAQRRGGRREDTSSSSTRWRSSADAHLHWRRAPDAA